MRKSYNALKQVSLIHKSGTCILNVDFSSFYEKSQVYKEDSLGNTLGNALVSSFLSAIDIFSREALGFDLQEISAENLRIFLNRTESIIIALIVDDSILETSNLRQKIKELTESIRSSIEPVASMIGEELHIRENPKTKSFLRKQIEQEIVRIFPDLWRQIAIEDQLLANIAQIRILTFLSDQQESTMYRLGKYLQYNHRTLKENLIELIGKNLTLNKKIRRKGRKIQVYAISEMGKLVLDDLDSGFSGIWMQDPTYMSG